MEVERGVAAERRPPGRPPAARVIPAIRLLNLDDLGAHVCENRPGERSRERLPDLDDPDAFERPGHDRQALEARGSGASGGATPSGRGTRETFSVIATAT